MKIEIKLKDPTKCDGCPFLYLTGIDFVGCDRYYFAKKELPITRPKKCIEENGE